MTDWLPMVHLINASAFVSLAQRERPQQGGTVEETEKEEKEKEKEREKEKEKDWCMIVNFYAPYCPFSARLAPYYNALPRVFPRLYVIGVDATDYSKCVCPYRFNNRLNWAIVVQTQQPLRHYRYTHSDSLA